MSSDGVVWSLPVVFVGEVAAWEVGSRLGLGFADPTWSEFGGFIEVERATWILAGVQLLLFAGFGLLGRRRSAAQVSLVQLVGVLALAGYWVGASLAAAGTVVAISTVATWVLHSRPPSE